MNKTMFGLVFGLVVFGSAASPVAAFENPIISWWGQLQNKAERMYLRLPGEKSGQSVLRQSFLASSGVESFQVEAEAVVDFESESAELASMSLRALGSVEIGQNKSINRQEINLSGEMNVEGTSYNLDVDLKQDHGTRYFRVNQMPVVPFFDLTQIRGEWLSLPASDDPEESGDLTSEQKATMNQTVANLIQKSEVSKALKQDDLFRVEVKLSKDAIIDFGREMGENNQSVDKLRQNLDSVGDINLVVEVDSKSFYPRHISLPIEVDPNQVSVALQVFGLPVSSLDGVKFVLSLDFSEYNQPVSFEIPQETRDASSVFMEIASQSAAQQPEVQTEVHQYNSGTSELPTLSPAEMRLLRQYEAGQTEI